jgi:hypothetical protein
MSIIKTIESTEQLDQVAYLPFISSRVDLLDFNSKIAYVIHNNLFSVIRKSVKNNISLDELVVFNEDLLSNKDVQYIVQLYSEAKFYPFSRKEFYASFFSNLIPSLADSVYNHLKATNRIVPIGSGQHKGFIINPSSFVNPNNITVLVDYSIYSGITNLTTFKVSYVATGAYNHTLVKYVNGGVKGGNVNSKVAFTVAFLLMVFGLTFAVSRITFSWFGIFVCLASIAVTAFAVPAWYITFLQVLDVIILVFMVISMSVVNYKTVT